MTTKKNDMRLSVKNILGTSGSTSGSESSGWPNVHLLYTTRIDHTIATVTGGSFYVDIRGFCQSTVLGVTVADPVYMRLYVLPSGLEYIGFQQQSSLLLCENVIGGLRIFLPVADSAVTYSLEVIARSIVGNVNIDYEKFLPGRLITALP